nr:ComEC/Rec2 family competence protein [Synechococcus sp. GEYO]
MHRLASALWILLTAHFWTLPLQWHHFGAAPLYALLSNLLVAPLLAPLTLAAMALAVRVLLLPTALSAALRPWLIWPLHPLLLLGLLPWQLPAQQRWHGLSLLWLLLAVYLQVRVQLGMT